MLVKFKLRLLYPRKKAVKRLGAYHSLPGQYLATCFCCCWESNPGHPGSILD